MRRIITLSSILILSCFFTKAQVSLVPFASGLSSPVDIKNCGDERLFVVDQPGYIYIFDTAGNRLSTPFLDIHTRVKTGSEQGLLGLAFAPDYQESGFFYVNYTAQTRGNTRISRFKVTPLDSNIANDSSEEILLEIWQPYSNHNGGHLAFGADGYLYIGTGDGGSGGDPENRSQNPDSLLGKMLRIEVNPAYPGYKIPPTNPYLCGGSQGRAEIWALGLRNPWRWSFDRCTGDLWIGDVGQGAAEEIDFQPANAPGGLNYGWRCYEGNSTYNLAGGCLPMSNYVAPVSTYSHSFGCSVTGGYVYRGSRYNDMFGKYFFTDYCTPTMYTLESDGMGGFNKTTLGTLLGSSYSSFGEDKWGDLYIASLGGSIYKFMSNDCTPVASINCDLDTLNDCGYGFANLSVPAGRDFTYTWYHNGNVLPEDSSELLTTQAGTYIVEVTNPNTLCSNSDTIEVVLGTPVNVQIVGLDTLYCTYTQSVNLQPSIPGGTFSGTGVTCFVFEPPVAGEGLHEIKYTYITPAGCRYETSQIVRVDACVGIYDNTWLKTVSLFPNPNHGTFTLEISSDRTKSLNIEISTMLGQVLYSESIEVNAGTTKFRPDYKIKDRGMYLVKLNDGLNTSVRRMQVN
ncbi:MAG: T9SS type A sorting domain-containing protein [Bacteroidetes bacterium]|nr:MAG: T9SS type A sorting domain-containing protein [Bacteroidota bacterium]